MPPNDKTQENAQEKTLWGEPSQFARNKVVIDALGWLAATPLAFLIRYDWHFPGGSWSALVTATLGLFVLKAGAAYLFSLYRRSWSRLAFRDVGNLLRMVSSVTLIGSVLLLWLGPATGIPRSIALLDGLLTLFIMSGVRAAARFRHEARLGQPGSEARRKTVLVIGAGEAGTLIVREMLRHPEMGLRPVGFLDDDPKKVGYRIATVPVLGTTANINRIVQHHKVDEVLIALPSSDGRVVREIVGRIEGAKAGLKYRIMPGVYELLSGQVGINRIREVQIEDLLRRPPIELDTAAISNYITDKVVMVTGAGGSIGSELVRQICRFRPKELILFGRGENSIYTLERELDRDWPDIPYHSVIANVQNIVRLDYVFRRYGPQVVFHAAAHKHVPLMELNPEEAVFNNIIGSRNLVTLSLKYGISHFVNISTDKAVNPTSVMGASKRIIEQVVQSASLRARPEQKFVSVRFGNVLGSRGSVIPVFKQQILSGGPVTVTHPDMTRYFMTIPEASQLVMQAAGQGRNGEIYILDMGEPVRIVDLARDLIKLSGFEPDVDIQIAYSGIRPGEKLYEELMTNEEKGGATAHEKIFVAKPSPLELEALDRAVQNLQEAALVSDHATIRQQLKNYISGSLIDDIAA